MQPDNFDEKQIQEIDMLVSKLKREHRRALKLHQDCSGIVACPVCGNGKVAYTISGYNKHSRGGCSTPGCIEWRE